MLHFLPENFQDNLALWVTLYNISAMSLLSKVVSPVPLLPREVVENGGHSPQPQSGSGQ